MTLMFVPGGFWGKAIKKGDPAAIDLSTTEDVLILTSATLGGKAGKERHILCCEVEGSKFVICSLTLGLCEQAPLNLKFFNQEVKFTVEGGNGEVHLTGYSESIVDGTAFDQEDYDMEESDEEDEDDEDYIQDEEVIRNTLRNQAMTTNVGKRKMIPITGGLGKKHKGDDSDEEEAGAGGKGLAEALRNTIFAASVESDDDEEYELDSDEDEGLLDSDEAESGDEDDDEDDDDDDEDDEMQAKHVAFGSSSEEESEEDESQEEKEPKKHKHENSKVQRQQTPGKPAKKPESTPKMANGKPASKTPQTEVKNKVKCLSCPKTFKDNIGLQQHIKAVHNSA